MSILVRWRISFEIYKIWFRLGKKVWEGCGSRLRSSKRFPIGKKKLILGIRLRQGNNNEVLWMRRFASKRISWSLNTCRLDKVAKCFLRWLFGRSLRWDLIRNLPSYLLFIWSLWCYMEFFSSEDFRREWCLCDYVYAGFHWDNIFAGLDLQLMVGVYLANWFYGSDGMISRSQLRRLGALCLGVGFHHKCCGNIYLLREDCIIMYAVRWFLSSMNFSLNVFRFSLINMRICG
ncbi:unnamed protein product [Eruca vesicaria subsp. sativa]|uniref:Uncharacterized protein n=1 Tax=Eruca vesicaria subsp. sativa TaxID=29727 RepID=A0ABC8M154_ERUVS|nr:unnamed protein product [Eruca vesicaria subsp. sativa]